MAQPQRGDRGRAGGNGAAGGWDTKESLQTTARTEGPRTMQTHTVGLLT